MQELEITWKRVLSVWWLVVWRGLVVGWLLAIALAYVIGYAGAASGLDFSTTSLIVTIISSVVGLAWGLVVAKMALNKNYQEFRLALIKKT